ncbi:MAG: TetR/AcrR family transcriptional regulator [Pseudomonadales bacterium]|nr:TetR/AcrR family transcriptional regulator [Pseudomonadales bacterium]
MPYAPEHKMKTRERILRSATDLFCRYGFDKVSISQVMKVARMTHGAFYAHFESKEALFRASLAEAFRRCKASRLAKAPLSLSHMTQLVNNYLTLRNLSESAPGPEAVLFNEIGSDRVEIKQLYEEAYFGMVKLLETRITALGRLRKIPVAGDAATVANRARAIVAALVGAVAIARSIEDEDEKQHLLVATQDQILSMLGVRDAKLELPGLA